MHYYISIIESEQTLKKINNYVNIVLKYLCDI